MSGRAAPDPDAPRPGPSIPLLLLGGLLSLVGAAGLIQLLVDAQGGAPRDVIELHAIAAALLAPGVCSVSLASDVWNARGHPVLALSMALIGLWAVAVLGLAMLFFRRRAP
ncbi:MAG: hypothetical protein IPL88_01810 [Rhizobiales bacterium]|nr:hypothetical protein [Hyphomicrobiales bacterium]